jgi:hypothetical protein
MAQSQCLEPKIQFPHRIRKGCLHNFLVRLICALHSVHQAVALCAQQPQNLFREIGIMHIRVSFAVVLLGCTLPVHAVEPPRPESAQQLVAEVIYNELHDRECDSFWQYRIVRIAGSQNVIREQVETEDGPIFRVVQEHGRLLDAKQREREDARLEKMIENTREMARVRQEHLQDEERMRRVMKILPEAFLFAYDGPADGDLVRITFRPNPAFTPTNYEARIIHALVGTFTVNQRMKRMVDMRGRLVERVDFGYGILGHVEKGGTFEIGREQVSADHWKTNLVEVHVEGKVLLFKNVTKDQRESRSDFRPVPHDISLESAKELLDEAAGNGMEARFAPAGGN